MSTLIHFKYWKDNERHKRGFAHSVKKFEEMRDQLREAGYHVDVWPTKITYRKPQDLAKALNELIY